MVENNTALESLIARCSEARRKYEASEIDFYEFLHDVMRAEQETWKVFTSFETFIERCVGRPNPAKWTRYVKARETMGIDDIRRIGIPAALEAIEIASPKVRHTYIDEMTAWMNEHHGVHPSEQHARVKRETLDPKPERATPSLNRIHEAAQLRAENAELRRENDRLTKDNVDLRERLTKLQADGIPFKGGARRQKGKSSEEKRV